MQPPLLLPQPPPQFQPPPQLPQSPLLLLLLLLAPSQGLHPRLLPPLQVVSPTQRGAVSTRDCCGRVCHLTQCGGACW